MHDAARALGALQLALVPAVKHDWQYGLVPAANGLLTQTLRVKDEEVQGVLDFQNGLLKLGTTQWSLDEYSPLELLKNERVWLEGRGITQPLKTPPFTGSGSYDAKQAKALGDAMWKLTGYAAQLKAKLKGGLTAPVLVYPHHFDLSLVWFPWDDERQLGFGFSPGDDMIHEPYLYVTAWPEPPDFTDGNLPNGAYWQQEGFSGAILPYAELRQHHQPARLLHDFAEATMRRGKELF